MLCGRERGGVQAKDPERDTGMGRNILSRTAPCLWSASPARLWALSAGVRRWVVSASVGQTPRPDPPAAAHLDGTVAPSRGCADSANPPCPATCRLGLNLSGSKMTASWLRGPAAATVRLDAGGTSRGRFTAATRGRSKQAGIQLYPQTRCTRHEAKF